MMNKGTKETKEFLALAFSITYAIARAGEDGKFSLIGDLPKFGGVVKRIAGGVRGLEQIPAELADLTQDEILDLRAFIKEEFNLPNEILEEDIERVIDVATDLVIAALSIKNSLANQ